MPVTHANSPTRDAMCNAVVGLVDQGSALASGRLQLSVDSGFTDVVVSVPLQNPAFAVASAGSGTSALNTGGGLSVVYSGGVTKTVNYFRFTDRDGVEVMRGTVSGPSGTGDMKLADNVIPDNTTITVTAFVYTTIP